jgi:hypothetical protein
MKNITILGALVLALTTGVAFAATSKLPNLTPYPAQDVRIENRADGTRHLRFSTLSWNHGVGPLEIRAGAVDTGSGKQQVFQRIYQSDGSYTDVFAGWFEYHPLHGHIHFENYALYTLQPLDANGGEARIGQKTTFCIMDTTRVDTKLPGASKKAVYKTCGNTVQGMSVGWGDKYGYQLEGQSIPITDLPDGDYALTIEVDPKGVITETNNADNVSVITIRLQGSTVTVLP